MATKVDSVNISTRCLERGFGSRVVKAHNAAYPDGTLRKPITFETIEGVFELTRIVNLDPNRKQRTMLIIGSGVFASSRGINRNVRIDLGLYAMTREGTIKFVSH